MAQFLDKPAILSPAGSPEALVAAVFNGADAVYLGLDKFNARMKADNFNTENLRKWVDFCHLFGVKVFVTVNVSIKNNEFEDACRLGVFCYENSVDGLIVTDVGLLKYFKEFYPDFDVTLSTQQNIHNVAGVKIAKELGCGRVVVSRETPLCDIERINECVDVDIEAFLHGALCVSVSGQCLFSSFIDGNSGNRGLCAQPCRQKYSGFIDGKPTKTGYLLSARDLCLARNSGKMAYGGVKMFKIEGRNRRPQYVAQTTKTYRKIFDNGFLSEEKDITDLKKIYNRGNFTNGYLANNANIIYPQSQGHIGVNVGKLIKIGKDWFVKGETFLHDGDAFKIFRNDEEVGNAVCLDSGKNGLAKVSVNGDCKVGDDVNITTSVAQISQLNAVKKSLSAEIRFIAKAGQRAKLTLSCNGESVTIESDAPIEEAQKQPTTVETITQQLSKTGNTYFTISKIVVDGERIFIPISVLNALRRKGIETLENKLVKKYNESLNRNIEKGFSSIKVCDTQTVLPEKLCIYIDEVSDSVAYRDDTIVVFKPKEYNLANVKEFVPTVNSENVYLDMPNFATEADYAVLKSLLKTNLFVGVVANNLYAVYLARELGLKIILGLGLNIYNDFALSGLKELCGECYKAFVYSQELSLAEINDFNDKNGFIFTDGEICLMTLAHCPLHVNLKCDCGCCAYSGKELIYKDKTNREFSLRRKRIAKCYWELFNCLPLKGNDKVDFKGKYLLKPSFSERKSVYEFYSARIKGENFSIQQVPHTTGHLNKKVK